MKCQSCGCTESTPCVTDAGPCHWVAPGYCSACLYQEHPPEEARVLEALLALRNDVVGIRLSGVDAFHLLAALQLALRHPHWHGAGRDWTEEFARGLQERLAEAGEPAVAELCEKGWLPEFDVAVEGLA